MDNVERLQQVIREVNEAAHNYYDLDQSVISDKEYDDLYDELLWLENETGIVYPTSPTRMVQGSCSDRFKKYRHVKPMLSAEKTKNISDIIDFLKDYDYYASYKLDGLTIVATYQDGNLIQLLTRGNGQIGEDVTNQAYMISNLPQHISHQDTVILRGECVISWNKFNKINENTDEYKHPRNLAAGSLRNLEYDPNKKDLIDFVVFEVIQGIDTDSKWKKLEIIDHLGFKTVQRYKDKVNELIKQMSADRSIYPVDGIVFEIDSTNLSTTLGSTAHHENCRMALKWEDTLYETILRDVQWQTTKTGLVVPVAIFDPVNLDGALTTRASVHNLSMVKKLKLGIGDHIRVYRANMIIPQIHDNLTCSNNISIPLTCPSCGASLVNMKTDISESLMCPNNQCKSKIIQRITHFCSRDAMNIVGLSEKIIERLIDYIPNGPAALYELYKYRDDLIALPGFGETSVDTILQNIENSKNVSFANFLNALSIPGIGLRSAEVIGDYFHWNWQEFMEGINHHFDFGVLPGIGENLNREIWKWLDEHQTEFMRLADNMHFTSPKTHTGPLQHVCFAVTGKLDHWGNRRELKKVIMDLGGTVRDTVTQEVDYLINNDKNSLSAKNKRASEYGIPIISEDDLIQMIRTF